MACLTPHPLLDLPLTNVTSILSTVDSVIELCRATLRHRLFRDAFKDNLQTVGRQIIRDQILEDVLPYARALLKSSKLQQADDKATRELLERL